MKKAVIFSAVIFMILGVSIAIAQISGSAHDLSGEGYANGEICIVCHTPHHADTSVTGSPLWNHEVTAATFTIYSSFTLDATDLGQPGRVSKLCLSCHDGTVAIDSFGGATGSSFVSGSVLLGTDLLNDHPVSFTYDETLATTDGELWDPTTANSGFGGTIDVDMLFNHKVECASCHDPHDDTNGSFLRKSNSGSALCLTCHDK